MTILVYRDGIMAADSGSWMGDAAIPWAEKLAHRREDRSLHGVCGGAAESETYLSWARGDRLGTARPLPTKDNDRSSFLAMFVYESEIDTVRLLTYCGEEVYRRVPYLSVGASSQCAYGALYQGATAIEAVEACILHGPNAMGPVRHLRFGE